LIPRKGERTIQTIQDLGLHGEIEVPEESAKKRFIYFDGSVQKLPASLIEVFTSPIFKGVLREIIAEPFRKRRYSCEADESIHDFIVRRFGENVASRLIDPLVAGIYAGDSKKLSVKSCFADLANMEKNNGSILRAVFSKSKSQADPLKELELWKALAPLPMYSFKNGISTLSNALSRKIIDSGVNVQLRTSLQDVAVSSSQVCVNYTNENSQLVNESFDHVIFAVSSKAAAKIMHKEPLLDEIRAELEKIKLASLYVVNVAYSKKVLPSSGFGFLVPSAYKDELPILGVTYDSETFPNQSMPSDSCTRLTVMIGGDRSPELLSMSKDALKSLVTLSLSKSLGINDEPEFMHVMLAEDCIAQYCVGHESRLRRIQSHLLNSRLNDRISLIGSSLSGVSVNSCISEAHQTISKLSNSVLA
jgi:oxygen-dependent protoporphyrinogen oxidase